MACKFQYEKREGVSTIYGIPFTEWTVRDMAGRKIGKIRKDGEQYSVYGGQYDANDNFVDVACGRLCATYRQAQAWFREHCDDREG